MVFQAEYCAAHGAPITARACRAIAAGLDRDSVTGRIALDWPGDALADALPLRLVAPFHALHRTGRCPALGTLFAGLGDDVAAIRIAVAAHDAEIAGWLNGPPQTNEPARSGALVAGLLVLARRFGLPFELLEIGSSAGLNLLIDRYRYTLGGVAVGPRDARVHIAPEWRGPPPPTATISIAAARGVDIAPIDLADRVAVERLLAYVWVDQPERLARLDAAIANWHLHPPRLDAGDAADWVEARLVEPRSGAVRVLMHSVVWPYLDTPLQQRIADALARAASSADARHPLAWLRYEWGPEKLGPHELRLTSWPGGEDRLLARGHPHGAWLEWLGEEGA